MGSAVLSSCDEDALDTLPDSYFMIQLNPDDIYMYSSGANPTAVRLDPLLNDSIKVDVSISYSQPSFGTISFVQNEGWFYKPNPNFFGLDNITYTVCYEDECWSASITMYVEPLPDPATCSFAIVGEEIVTDKNAPIGIHIFLNDTVCPYQGSGVWAPEKGKFEAYSYSGNYKNFVYVYYPPLNFTGTDRFKYRLFTADGGFLETYCTITVK